MNKKFELWLFIFFTLALVLVRPTFLGQQYTLIGFFIASFIFIIKYISFDSDFYVVSKKSDVEILQLFTLFVFYSLSGLISALGNSNSFCGSGCSFMLLDYIVCSCDKYVSIW